MAFHQIMQWSNEGEMKPGETVVPNSRDLEDNSEEYKFLFNKRVEASLFLSR